MHAEVREKSRVCAQTEREREWGVREEERRIQVEKEVAGGRKN